MQSIFWLKSIVISSGILSCAILSFNCTETSYELSHPPTLQPSENNVDSALGIAGWIYDGEERDFQFQAFQEMGITNLRTELQWHNVEKSPGVFNFSAYEDKINAAVEAGINIIGLLGYGNPIYPNECGNNDRHCPPADYDLFGNYVYAMVEHFKDRITMWEIWNEQNAGYRFWKSNGTGDPDGYGALLKIAYSKAKQADPNCQVAYGGLFYYPQIIKGAEEFLSQSLDYHPDLIHSFDALAFHPYDMYPPSNAPEYSEPDLSIPIDSIPQQMQKLQQVLRNHNKQDCPIWITEVGWPTSRNTLEEQAQYLVRSLILILANGGNNMMWYTLRDLAPDYGIVVDERYFGLVEYGEAREPKPSYYAYAALSDQIGDLFYAGDYREYWNLDSNSYAFVFMDKNFPQKIVYTLWNDSQEQEVALIYSQNFSYELYDFYGQSLSLIQDGQYLYLTLSEDVLYLYQIAKD